MHHHAYLWTGPKPRFDQEALRRPPHHDPPPAGARPELIQRYREVAAEFPASDLPPLETAYWLVKARSLVRGTWHDPRPAAAWLGERLVTYTPRFASPCDPGALVASAHHRLAAGDDVSLGFYLERPAYLCLALVTCTPNRQYPALPCPTATPPAPPPPPPPPAPPAAPAR
ncbi:hypothetical protein ACFRI7_14255 [Streptomyces sp. NPDC056716]|uniref:hypothetical protein n=1 Tax=unclassified Streptomyces TaxID=2593676 RepID=UPI00367B0B53